VQARFAESVHDGLRSVQGGMTSRRCVIAQRCLFALAILSCASCGPIWGLPESSFDLPSNSRLPRWFKVPDGRSRGDVSMRVMYYAPPFGGDDMRFDLEDRAGRILDQANQYGGFNPGEGPRYVICRVGATIEVLDHSVMGPIVRVVDDPAVVSAALDFVKMEHCF